MTILITKSTHTIYTFHIYMIQNTIIVEEGKKIIVIGI